MTTATLNGVKWSEDLTEESHWKNGELLLERIWWEKEKCKSEIPYRKGKIHGMVRTFDINGNPTAICCYTNGYRDGSEMIWKDGCCVVLNWENDRKHGAAATLINDEKIHSSNWYNGVKDGYERRYNGGKRIYECYWKEGKKHGREYDLTLGSIVYWVNGVKEGIETVVDHEYKWRGGHCNHWRKKGTDEWNVGSCYPL